MIIKCFTFGPFMENTYILHDETKMGIVIDPGCSQQDEYAVLNQYISDQSIQLQYLVNTHCHVDHVQGNAYVKRKYDIPLLIHSLDEPVLRAVKVYAPNFGFTHYEEVLPDEYLEHGQVLKVGEMQWDILHLPGHSPGHIGLYEATQKVLIGGDVLLMGAL